MNANRNMKIVNTDKRKNVEKLSSGYRINRAADDAAGLAISEKMRYMIRGLNQGTKNAQDGVSWVQIGDGSLEEIDEMLHRMKELTVKAMNGTNTDEDRAYMQAEFDQLQSEIDHITKSAEFNTKPIFSEHESTYYQLEGNKVWQQDEKHNIYVPDNTLEFSYIKSDGTLVPGALISVPEGEYTTQELIDEMEDAFRGSPYAAEGFNFEYTDKGTCNFNYEGGQKINEVSGRLSSLLYDAYEGGSLGALIGTTAFLNETDKLAISSRNNNMSFTIEDEFGNQTTKDITIPNGRYTRQQLIDLLNNQLSDTSVTATKHGTGIKLGSNDSIITGFKGNMFEIDTVDPKYTSVFYDNVKHGNITMSHGEFTGGLVRTTNAKDPEHQKYHINSTNNTLTFTANGSNTPIGITIPDGDYTATQMSYILNQGFAFTGLDLTASVISGTSSGTVYEGLKITSNVLGATSAVGIDRMSSAYNTLFVNRDYLNFSVVNPNNYTGNSYAKVMGAKTFSTSDGSLPLTITSGVNDAFSISVNSGSYYEVTMPAGTYNTIADIRTAINTALNDSSLPDNIQGKIVADDSVSGVIALKNVESSGIRSISVRNATNSANTGYKDIFVQETEVPDVSSSTSTGGARCTSVCNTAVPPNPTIPANSVFEISYTSGNSRNDLRMSIPAGNYTDTDLINLINTTFSDRITPITFTQLQSSGTTSTAAASNVSGQTTYNSNLNRVAGVSIARQGVAGDYTTNTPAKISTTVPLTGSYQVNSSNNTLNLTINGTSHTITVADGNYTASSLKNALQTEIDNAFGNHTGGAIVSESNGLLTFATRLNNIDGSTDPGAETSISFTTSNSPLIKEIQKQTTKGTSTSPLSLKSNINLDNTNNVLKFSLQSGGYNGNVDLTLGTGTYTAAGLVSEINSKLQAQNIAVTASLDNGQLKLTTNASGTGNTVRLAAMSSNDAFSEAVFNNYKTPATTRTNKQMQSSITIDSSTDGMDISVNNTNYHISIPAGTYNRSQFVNAINAQLTANNVPATASLYSSSYLQFTTTAAGSNNTISYDYNTAGTSKEAIFGTTTKYGVTCELDADRKLKITGNDPGTGTQRISVNSATGSIFQTGTHMDSVFETYTTASGSYAYIDGVSLSGSIVTIDSTNNALNFRYTDNGVSKTANITLPSQTYTFTDLKDQLQAAIDSSAVGPNELRVSVGSSGVRIETLNPGSSYQLNDFSGSFYDRVIGSASSRNTTMSVSSHDGNQANDDVYTVGRQNVRNGVSIDRGLNDTLSLDLTINGNPRTFSFTLDPGTYSGSSLIDEIQTKLNSELRAQGLPENLIKAQVGGVDSGVAGADDANALVFKLARDVRLPNDETGEYIIDGVRGNAAFSLFYQTDGDLNVAYTKGTKDISGGVNIEAGDEDLYFDYDGDTVSVSIPAGNHSAEEIRDYVQTALDNGGYDLNAEISDGYLKIVSTRYGVHHIDKFRGPDSEQMFFQANSDDGPMEDINIQFSSIQDDHLSIERRRMGTSYLGINSITISKIKYAEKADARLKKALEKVSETRSYFGATQNRIEHAISNNENKAENLQAAESRVRDTDMAKIMVSVSISNILEQAGQAVLAQANQSSQGILSLLQ